MYEQKIRLNEAMTKDIGYKFLLWKCPGIHFKSTNNLQELGEPKTFVIKCGDLMFEVGVEGMSQNGCSRLVISLADFSSLEELKKNAPHLFELEGELEAFS